MWMDPVWEPWFDVDGSRLGALVRCGWILFGSRVPMHRWMARHNNPTEDRIKDILVCGPALGVGGCLDWVRVTFVVLDAHR